MTDIMNFTVVLLCVLLCDLVCRVTADNELVMRCTLNIKHHITYPLVYKYCIITEGNVIYEDLESAMHHYRGVIKRCLIISQGCHDKGITTKSLL